MIINAYNYYNRIGKPVPHSQDHSGSNLVIRMLYCHLGRWFHNSCIFFGNISRHCLKDERHFSQNKIKPHLNMQLTGKLISKPWMLLKSIEKQKWCDAAGTAIFCPDVTTSDALEVATGWASEAGTEQMPKTNIKKKLKLSSYIPSITEFDRSALWTHEMSLSWAF